MRVTRTDDDDRPVVAPLIIPRADAMRRLGIRLGQFTALVERGDLNAEQHGKYWYVTTASVDALVARWQGEAS